MLRHLDVSRLTRPARLRCCPDLVSRSKWTAAARPKPVKKTKTKPENIRNPTEDYGFGSRRAERADYVLAKKIQAERAPKQTSQSFRRLVTSSSSSVRPLPSLKNPQTFHSSRSPKTVLSQAKPSTYKGKEKEVIPPPAKPTLRRNPVGVQLLSPSLHKQLFPGRPLPQPIKPLITLSTQHLLNNGLKPAAAAVLEEINLDMPPLLGKDIRDHFHTVGQESAEPYLSLAQEFVEAEIPTMPETWVTDMPGWIKYHADGSFEPVEDLGDEKVVSFDVEVLYKISPYPIIATAVSPNAWYSWLCPTIFQNPPIDTPEPALRWDKTPRSHLPHDLIPLFPGKEPRLVIGHNVGYDRGRIKEEYNLEGTSTRYLDTLSLHVATRGITSVQRPAWIMHRKNRKAQADEEEELREAIMDYYSQNGDADFAASLTALSDLDEVSDDLSSKRWEDITAVNSLAEVARLHCGTPVDKSIRSRFGDDDIKHASQLRSELDDLVQYCADDVRITHEVYKKVFPLFTASCPHPASFAGILTMGSSFLPVNESWSEYIRNAEKTYREMEGRVTRNLRSLAEKARKDGPKEDDPWLSQLDWTPKKARWVDQGPEAPLPALDALKEAFPDQTDAANVTSTPSDTIAESSTSTKPTPENDIQDINTPSSGTTPTWYALASNPDFLSTPLAERRLVPLLLRMEYKGHPVVYLSEHKWCFSASKGSEEQFVYEHGEPVALSDEDGHLKDRFQDTLVFRLAKPSGPRRAKLTGKDATKLSSIGFLATPYHDIAQRIFKDGVAPAVEELKKCATDLLQLGQSDPWGTQLDWTPLSTDQTAGAAAAAGKPKAKKAQRSDYTTWPKWYYDLSKAATQLRPGELDISQKKLVTPLLLRLKWLDYPLVLSKNFKWVYRVPRRIVDRSSKEQRLSFGEQLYWTDDLSGDEAYREDLNNYYFRLPHQNGEGKNVGSPLAKQFVKYLEAGKLSSAGSVDGDDDTARIARDATQMNVLCSYWVSSRERIMDQMVVYDSPTSGIILPQVITMGTVTRRAVESTWLTASNAKKNRVGSELKAMVRAPPGYAIVGADVDSEELWISSVMGDAQFGMHGGTAIGWMTLEGTKSAGTDLHSKTASILGTSRDAAKVFNYSRIYGAGVKHAVQLLMQGDATLTKEAATQKAKALYSATKGEKAVRDRRLPMAASPSIWHGGSESFLFNTLESIALSDRPTTPALGCGVTKALSKVHLGADDTFLPSRINWVVQSSGVDYLHLLIVSMDYLIKRYNIDARYLISVHDEVRYLAKDTDRYRAALALQIANAWTRALFCYNLGIDDVPQGVTFFSAVDIDHVLRKEVFMPCTTPSHPSEIPPGESLNMKQLLERISSLGNPVSLPAPTAEITSSPIGSNVDTTSPKHYAYLQAQAERRPLKARNWLNNQPDELDAVGEALPSPVAYIAEKRQKKELRAEQIKSLWDEINVKDLDMGRFHNTERPMIGRGLPRPTVVKKKEVA